MMLPIDHAYPPFPVGFTLAVWIPVALFFLIMAYALAVKGTWLYSFLALMVFFLSCGILAFRLLYP